MCAGYHLDNPNPLQKCSMTGSRVSRLSVTGLASVVLTCELPFSTDQWVRNLSCHCMQSVQAGTAARDEQLAWLISINLSLIAPGMPARFRVQATAPVLRTKRLRLYAMEFRLCVNGIKACKARG
jgi:hypothetical protein